MASDMQLRQATKADLPQLLEVYLSAFSTSFLDARCFPRTDPSSTTSHLSAITSYIPDLILVEHTPTGQVLGWARWARRSEAPPPPPATLTEDMYPSSGDRQLACRFFQAHVDATHRIVDGRRHWYLSPMAVRKEAQGKGVGGMLMKYGAERADEDGWIAYTSGSQEGKRLYERFGFRTVEVSQVEPPDIVMWHMVREPKVVENGSQ